MKTLAIGMCESRDTETRTNEGECIIGLTQAPLLYHTAKCSDLANLLRIYSKGLLNEID